MGIRKIALVDDEPETLLELANLCRLYCTENFVEFETVSFTNGEDFLKAVFKYDKLFSIVFMDIYMPGMSGIDAAQRLREKSLSSILIFLTTSTEHMPEAFSCHAFEYVIKPFSQKRIFQVLRDACRILPDTGKYIEIISGRKKFHLSCAEIRFVITDAHYLDVNMADGAVVRSRMKMSEFLHLIGADDRFILVNKGILINADYILNIQENACLLDSGQKFPIRIRDAARIEKEIRDYNFKMIRRKQQHGKGQP